MAKKEKNFFEQVFDVVREIPAGRVTSYGAIAEYLGSKGSSRMVGWAMNASHTTRGFIPTHRVVNRNGQLTGRLNFPDPDLMEELLTSEHIRVENNQVVDFKEKFWDPNIELRKKKRILK